MIHVINWHVEQWLGEWELRSARHRSVIAKNIMVRGGEPLSFSPLTQHKRWSFDMLPALGAEETCTRLACRIWHTHANWLCLCRLSKMLTRWGEGKTPNHPTSNGGKMSEESCLQLFRLPSNDGLLYIAHWNLALRNQDDVIMMPSQARGS